MKEWNRKNALWMVLYAVLYAVGTALVCVTGAITPVLFVCYQITAGIILSGIVVYAFRKVQAPGVAACLGLALILLLIVISDAVTWHVIPVIVIAVLAEAIRAIFKYNWTGDVIGTVIMTFSSFAVTFEITTDNTAPAMITTIRLHIGLAAISPSAYSAGISSTAHS